MAEISAARRLAGLSRKWRKPVVKLPASLIKEIHKDVTAHTDLRAAIRTVYKSGCFPHVLWQNFHEDISNSHLELLLLVLVFELQKGGSSCWRLISQDSLRFSALLERLLADTVRPGYEGLNGLILVFLGHLFSTKNANDVIINGTRGLLDESILANFPHYDAKTAEKSLEELPGERSLRLLKQKWLFTVLDNFTKLAPIKGEEARFSEYLKCLFYLLTILVGQPATRESVKTLLKETSFISKIGEGSGSKTLQFYVDYPFENGSESVRKDENTFYKLQTAVFGLFGDHPWLEPFFLIPSFYETTPSEVDETLQKLSLEQLTDVAKELDITVKVDGASSHSNLARLLSDYAFTRGSQYSLQSLISSISSFSESDTVDRYLASANSRFYVPESVPTESQYISSLDYLHRAISCEIDDFCISCGKEIDSVLRRLTMVDPENDTKNAIKGQSKYFTRIESLNDGDLQLRAKDWDNGAVKKGDYIALLHLQKPIKYSPHKRIVDHGLSLVRLVKVKLVDSKNRKLKVELEPSEANVRLNYAIRFSKTTTDKVRSLSVLEHKLGPVETRGKIELPSFLTSFLGQGSSTPPTIPKTLKIVSRLHTETLKEDYNLELGTKKRKGNTKGLNISLAVESTLLFSKDNSLIIKDTKSEEPGLKSEETTAFSHSLNAAQTRALISSMGQGLTLIKAPPHSGAKTLINGILLSLNASFPKERTLLILPNSSYVLRFEVSDKRIRHKLVKVSAIENSIKDIDFWVRELLANVEALAKTLGLANFGYHETFDNAQLLYDVHVEPKWRQFLKELSQDEKNYVIYPFKEYSELALDSETPFREIVTSFSQIRGVFAELQKLSPLSKFPEDTDQLGDYLIQKYSNVVCVSHEHLSEKEVTSQKYDTTIVLENETHTLSSILSVFNNPALKRMVLFSGSGLYSRFLNYGKALEIEMSQIYNVRREILALGGVITPDSGNDASSATPNSQYNPGIKETVQLVKLPATAAKVNLDEAEFTVSLFQYFRLLGYPKAAVSIVVSSPYQMILIKEVLVKAGIPENEEANDSIKDFRFGWPILEDVEKANCNDYVIVSLHNSESEELLEDTVAAKARLGLYYVGDEVVAKIAKGPLEIYTGGSYRKATDHRESNGEVYQLLLAQQFKEYVDQMTKTRRGTEK